MATCAENYQILFDIIPQPAARAQVVYLKILWCAAVLATPSIAREHLAGEPAIRLGFKPQSRRLPFGSVQGRFSPCPAVAISAPRGERR
jgi:hypothetical protein